MAAGKEIFDGVVIGGFDNNVGTLLASGTPAEVVDATHATIAEAGPDRFGLGADCTVPATIGLDRFEVVRLAASDASRTT